MGSSASKEDRQPLIGDDEEIQPIFEDLKLVLIGSQGAGKNAIANAILGKKVFTFWTSFKSKYVKETCRVSGTRIHLTRTPGWTGDLSRSGKTKREIVRCVQSLFRTGPHAVILALKVNSMLSESTINTLESLLTVQVWDHTIVLFTHGEKLGDYTIEDYIRYQQLQSFIQKCGKRYFVIENNSSNQITDTIQELVAKKNSAFYFKLSAQIEDNNALESDWRLVVERIKSKITSLLAFREKLRLDLQMQNSSSLRRLLDSKNAEINRLNAIVQEKEREIERLCSGGLDPSGLHRRPIAELDAELKGRNAENETLKERNDKRKGC
ncbi:GTPase IMAP family member 9-like [Puntigrus tetrazona]|uniref:GTPase IMAP family member 9-like n=1 Tax=Puntigrus tetrazona TaxID=1606681 RepID=UPI001C8A89D8|nr:GTPase IMAP family member 9-like [Puntigrus tetrazona]